MKAASGRTLLPVAGSFIGPKQTRKYRRLAAKRDGALYCGDMATITIPDESADRIAATGEEVNHFPVATLLEKVAERERATPRTFGDLLTEGWVPPTIKGTPCADGRPWSEIEAACD